MNHQLEVAEIYRNVVLHCRRYKADELNYKEKCAESAQKSLDRFNGKSRILKSVEEFK